MVAQCVFFTILYDTPTLQYLQCWRMLWAMSGILPYQFDPEYSSSEERGEERDEEISETEEEENVPSVLVARNAVHRTDTSWCV